MAYKISVSDRSFANKSEGRERFFYLLLNSQIRHTRYHQRDMSIPIPPNYTCMAVIATIFFFPVGVFAILYAIKVCTCCHDDCAVLHVTS